MMLHKYALTLLGLILAIPVIPACRAVHAPQMLATGSTSVARDFSETETDTDPSVNASIWPTRWGDDPSNRGVIIELDPLANYRPIHYSRYHQGRSTPTEYEDAAQLAAALGIERGFKFKPEGPGAFVFVEDTLADEPVKDPPTMRFKYVSAQRMEAAKADAAPDDIDAREDHVTLERTWFTFRDPKPGKDTLGTIVLLPGMFGTPEPIVNAAERYWTTKGYAVLRMSSHPSRYTQHMTLPYFDGRTESIARQAAQSADQRVAECAYATHAALDHVFAQRASLEDHPVVLVGMSGGAMALPSVYAQNPERYDAAVLIAGGANFLRIMIESNYSDWIDAILIDFDPMEDDLGSPPPGVLDTLSERYLQLAQLDAYHTAPALANIPVLLLHATNDKAVPAETGDLLYERLGKPERWTYPMGHELIFAALPTQIPRIDSWLSDKLHPAISTGAGQ
jgi:alpha-beta hydrolase superfamily lysophospholipase